MAMNIGGGKDDEPMMEINTTPLIDVMLVLLVMLIITIPIQTHAVKLDMPRNVQTPPQEPKVVDLELDFDGTVLWNGVAVPDSARLDQYLRSAAAETPQPEIHLKPNRLVKYDHVARVLAAAQRAGVTRIGFVGNEQYMD
ncbi:biopolymer transporter ExbD [Parvibaculum sp.]|uniref:ExbD/TolR family protein n=1 Tax=Parvibaculum sp. TaxID=2024848 RepID=UPI00320CB174